MWPRGPMDKASAHGAGDCRFESCRGHLCTERALSALPAREEQEEIARRASHTIPTHCVTQGQLRLIDWGMGGHADKEPRRSHPGRFELTTLRWTASRSGQLSFGRQAHVCRHLYMDTGVCIFTFGDDAGACQQQMSGVQGAHGVVASHPLRMRKALGSNPSVSTFVAQGAERNDVFLPCCRRCLEE